MKLDRRGCGCLAALLAVVAIAAGLVVWKFLRPGLRTGPSVPAAGLLQIHMLDVGQGDAILIISPGGKTVLVDAGDTGKGGVITEAMRRHGLSQIDLFIASHAHADHIGAADEVLRAVKVLRVLESGIAPPAPGGESSDGRRPAPELPTTKAYADMLRAIEETGALRMIPVPGDEFDIGGGAVLKIIAPLKPYFTKEQLRAGGNEPNANSVVARLEFGDFSMLLTGDAEAQTEDRLLNNGVRVTATVLKVGHHGSRYATSSRFLGQVKPEIAVISDSEKNRYGHPSQPALDRLRAAGAVVFRTDLHGEITITSTGKRVNGQVCEVRTERSASRDVWAGREAQRDDSSRSGFISFGDFEPQRRESRSRRAGR